MKTIKLNYLFIMMAFLGFNTAIAQVGIGTENPKATLDVEASTDATKTDGIIAPRLSGDDLAAKDALYGTDQTGAIVYATAPVGTPTTKTANVTDAGYYYFDGSVWVGFDGAAIAGTEPWFNQADDTEATANTQNIYQTGNVAIQKTDNYSGTALDVEGAAYIGINPTGSVGSNSLAVGDGVEASGRSSLAVGLSDPNYGITRTGGRGAFANGYVSQANDDYSFASGSLVFANATGAAVFGWINESSGQYSLIAGNQNVNSGEFAFVTGIRNEIASYSSAVFGRNNAIKTGDPTGWLPTDALFQVGNGGGTPNNALTILKNGDTGIGIAGTEAAAKPTERLDIGSGNVRVRDINTNTGAATDNVVVADANGVLKTRPAGSQNLSYRTLASGTIADSDYTVEITGNVALPAANASNTGRVYNIINGNTNNNTVSGTFKINGGTFTDYTLNNSDGGRGVMVQSTGSAWLILNRY